jgi:hypothetical protein
MASPTNENGFSHLQIRVHCNISPQAFLDATLTSIMGFDVSCLERQPTMYCQSWPAHHLPRKELPVLYAWRRPFEPVFICRQAAHFNTSPSYGIRVCILSIRGIGGQVVRGGQNLLFYSFLPASFNSKASKPAASSARIAPNRKGAPAPNPFHCPMPCHKMPAMRLAGKAIRPMAAL